jgi:kynurenine 3-monooxygenase
MSKIVITGGGLVGSLLALSLKRCGFSVSLFEKRSDPRLASAQEGRSINLIITSRGLNALQKVGLAADALKLAVPVYGRMMHSITGELTYQAYGRPDECNYSISRAELNCFLLDRAQKAGVELHFSKTTESVDFDKRELVFSDGQRLNYDFLFATEGTGSRVREELCRVRPDIKSSIDFLSAGYKELTMPLLSDGSAALQKEALHIWPRGQHMLMALPNRDGSFTMTLYLPHKGGELSFDSIQTANEARDYFTRFYPDALELMPNAIDEYTKNMEGKLGTVRLSQWLAFDSVCLLGDASHGIVPFFGQGMNSGFEDVAAILDRLDQHHTDPTHAKLIAVLAPLVRERKVDTDAIADMAIENFTEMSEKVGDQDFLLRKKVESKLEEHFPHDYRSRYGMITYTLIPYHHAYELGLLQNKLLDELCNSLDSVEKLDLEQAKQAIERWVTPYKTRHQLCFKRFTIS